MTGPYQEKGTPSLSLVEAASAGDLSSVKTLLDTGAEIDSPNQGGQTPLILAAVMGHTDVVAHLVEAGADPNLRDHLGLTAYEWSTRRGFREIESLLAKVSPPILQPKPHRDEPKTEAAPPTEPITAAGTSTSSTEQVFEMTLASAAAQSLETPNDSTAPSPTEFPSELKYSVYSDDNDSILDLPESLTSGSQPLPHYFDPAPPTPPKSIPALTISSPPPQYKASDADRSASENSPSITRPTIEPDETISRVKSEPATHESSWLGTMLSAGSSEYTGAESFEKAAATERGKSSSSLLGLSSSTTTEDSSATHFEHHPAAATPSSPTSMVVWLLIAFVLGASAFAAYRLTRYLYRAADPPAPTAPTTVAAPVPEIKKPGFSVGGDLAGAELNIPEPELSSEVVRSGASGPITVRVRVNKNGRVISAAARNGDRSLRTAAVKAARQATFSKERLAELNSRSKVISGTITYEFPPPAAVDNAATSSNTNSPATATTPSTLTNVDPNAPQVSDALVNAVKSIPAADYPVAARRAGVSGTIIVTVRVNRTGKVISWRSSSGNSQLRAAAIKAARKATFAPDKLSGDGDTLGTITYNFVP